MSERFSFFLKRVWEQSGCVMEKENANGIMIQRGMGELVKRGCYETEDVNENAPTIE